MSFETRQKAVYEGHDWWQWSVWIEGTKEGLDSIQTAIYFLHPTFPDRIRKIEDRTTKFRLDSGGWGGFRIRIELKLKSGEKVPLSHDLELEYPEESSKAVGSAKVKKRAASRKKGAVPGKNKKKIGVSSRPPKPEPISNVFISSAATDQGLAAIIRETLKQEKIKPTELAILPADAPVEIAVRDAIRGSDAVVAIRSETPSAWVDSEIAFAKSSGKPVIMVDAVKKEVSLDNPKFSSAKAGGKLDKLSTTLGKSLKATFI